MSAVIRATRAEPDPDQIDDETASLIKGMLARGDKQSDIAACFRVNSGRIAEINLGQRFTAVKVAPPDVLPPAGPYPSPFDLWKSKRAMWRARVALEAAATAIQEAMVAVHKAEQQ